jgi:predicted nuclease of predicted toxin-antitoxin system
LLRPPIFSVWNYARRKGLTIVTHDADFAELAALHGPPPKVVWLGCGNRPTAEIERLLRDRAESITSFLEDSDATCLELY